MSILHLVRCECYEHCKQEYLFGVNMLASDLAPDTWITLFEGNPRTSEGWNFCSKECLFDWMMEHWEISGGFKRQEPQEQSECKARRFLLVDGETADITECVLWKDGLVGVDPETSNRDGRWFYASWEDFKANNPGSGVQWIDQEVGK